jgi:hypothetical protein
LDSWSAPEAGSSVEDTWTEPGPTPAPPSWSSRAGGTREGEGVEPAATGGEAGRPTYADYAATPDAGAIPEPGAGPIPGWSKPSGIVGSWATKIIALAIAVGFLISNLVGFLGDDEEVNATPFPTGPRASMTGSLGPYEAMAVGDCIAIPEAQQFSEVLFVSCTAEHDAEVFHVGSSPGSDDDYPSDDEFEAYVDEACVPAFHDYTGSDFYDQSELQMGWFVPAEETWASGDHTVHCYLTPADGSTTSVSWRGANP